MAAKKTRTIRIRIETDPTPHERAMRKMRKDTDQETRAAGQAVEKNLGGSMKKVSRLTRQMGRDVRTLSSGLGGLSSGLGQGTRMLGSFTTGIAAAAGAAGPAGIAVAAIGLAGLAATAGVAKLGMELIEVTAGARELQEVAKQQPQFIDAEQVQRLVAADDALEAVGLAAKGAAVAIASEFAPEIRGVSELLVAGGLYVRDFVEDLGGMRQMLDDVNNAAIKFQTEGLGRFFPANMLVRQVQTAEGMEAVNKSIHKGTDEAKDYLDEARNLIDSYKGMETGAKGAAKAQADLNAKLFAAAEAADKEAIGIYNAALSDTRSEFFNLNTELGETVNKLNELKAAGGDADFINAAGIEIYNRHLRDTNAAMAEWSESASAEGAAVVAEFDTVLAGMEARQQQTRELMVNLGGAMVGSLSTTFDNIAQLAEGSSSKLLKKLAKRQAMFQKAGAIADGARAALAGFTPPPVGFGPAGGFAFLPFIAAQTATQVAVIEKSTSEVKHSGGGINGYGGGARGPMAPDEVQITGKDGEFMVNGMGRSTAGDAALNGLNRGEGLGGGPPVFALQLDHRYMSEFVARDIRLPGSVLGKAINRNADIGYRKR